MKHLVTGGGGFVGSHLIDKIISTGEFVYCLDNFMTGNYTNINHLLGHKNFKLIEHDITNPIDLEIDKIWHLACPASPKHYQKDPIKTSKINFIGTLNMLELALKQNAHIFLASTSEIYGDPEVSPQTESYKGSVNNIGIRSCYDEGKRIAESLCFDYHRVHDINIHVARIFNTYGPRMSPKDGRVISNFIVQAISKKDLTIYGDGKQTRSFCYVDDLVSGIYKLMYSDIKGPLNLGNPNEITINKLSKIIRTKINKDLKIIHKPLPKDDPLKRKPSIELAKKEIDWAPKIDLEDGLNKTINYFKMILSE